MLVEMNQESERKIEITVMQGGCGLKLNPYICVLIKKNKNYKPSPRQM